jgi:hyperosmotically inducible periplasmic protein
MLAWNLLILGILSNGKTTMNLRLPVLVLVSALFLGACASDRTVGSLVDDAAIVTRANAALAGSPVTSAWDVSVESRNGTVLLSGFVEDNRTRAEAERLVAQIDGVESVRNNIELRPAN